LGIYFKPFDVNFDGLLDIVFYGYSPTEPNIFFMNNGNGFELKEFNLDQFDGSYTYWDGTQYTIQQWGRLQHSYFLESNDGYIFITGINEALIAFRITDQNFNMFIK
jgi:hypothetical protein